MSTAVFTLADRQQTQAFGERLGRLLRSGDVVALVGDLGTGKTTLTQAIAHGMGITESVTSPTFTLVQEYLGPVPLFHFDTYRLENPEMVADFGFEDYFQREGVLVIEWADRIASLLPPDRLTITLTSPPDPLSRKPAPQGERGRGHTQDAPSDDNPFGGEKESFQTQASPSPQRGTSDSGRGGREVRAAEQLEVGAEDTPRQATVEAGGPRSQAILAALQAGASA